MRSNEHSKDRQGSWHPEGLEGAALRLVQGDEKNGRYNTHHKAVPCMQQPRRSLWVMVFQLLWVGMHFLGNIGGKR